MNAPTTQSTLLPMLPINLMRFCNPADLINKQFQEPFTHGEYSYGCNGHIIVRVPKIETITKAFEPVKNLFWKCLEGSHRWQSISTIEFEEENCQTCSGNGKEHSFCPTCECPCKKCLGAGKVGKHATVVKVGDKSLNAYYVWLLKTLPGCSISLNIETPNSAIPFKFEGGDGLLMPMRD